MKIIIQIFNRSLKKIIKIKYPRLNPFNLKQIFMTYH